ncbi:MAG TPA: hypothetical protein DEQ68_03700 [Ruminococcaceae bacterium]|nr:hypothetical protein [Oscillospiraceae bacterium]
MPEEKKKHDADRRVVRTKKAIKTAHLSLMEEKDISDITISELTRKAGINRRTFYTHYRSVSEIIDEIESDMVSLLGEIVLKVDVNDIRRSISNIFLELNEMISVDFDYYFHRVRMDMRGVFMTRLKKISRELAERFLEENANLKRETVETMAEFIIGGFFNVFVEWRSRGDMSAEEAARLAGLMVEGCANSVK